MSWDSYLDNLVAQSKDATGAEHVDKCCIFGLDGGASWTTSGHAKALQLSAQESAAIASAMKSKSTSSFTAGGIMCETVKYMFLREENDCKIVYGKKKDHGAITIQVSKTAVVMAHCPEGKQAGNANKGVNVIAEYLESLGM